MRVPQPTPSVTAADVERLARREFPNQPLPEILAILGEYGTEDWHREADRVRAAVLKLSQGSLERLRYWTEQAKLDYRDVLSPAEYPRFPFSTSKLTDEQHNEIIRLDWEQYARWFER